MTDILLPLIGNSSQQWSSSANDRAGSDIFTGTQQVISVPGQKWGATLNYTNLVGDEFAWMESFLGECKGRSNTFYMWDIKREGLRKQNFSGSRQLVPDGDAETADDTSSFGFNPANTILEKDGYFWRAESVMGGVNAFWLDETEVSFFSGNYYTISGYYGGTNNGGDVSIQVGSTNGGNQIYGPLVLSEASRFFFTFLAEGVNFVQFRQDNTTDGDFSHWGRITASRCGIVDGASQTGDRLQVGFLPASTTEVASIGDMVEIGVDNINGGSTLHTITRQLNSKADRSGILCVEPPIVTAPADGSPVSFFRSSAKMRLAESRYSRADTAPIFAGYTIDTIQADP